MIQNQYQLKVVNAATGTAVVVASGNATIHTVNFPKATSGVSYLTAADGTIIVTYPTGSIGSMRYDAAFPGGVSIGTVAADSVHVTYQAP